MYHRIGGVHLNLPLAGFTIRHHYIRVDGFDPAEKISPHILRNLVVFFLGYPVAGVPVPDEIAGLTACPGSPVPAAARV